MSGPAPLTSHDHERPREHCIEVYPAHEGQVGELTVRRALPTRHRRMVGAWCFADHMGPALVQGSAGLNVGPHPHMGLQTVTWLVEGEILHKDSLGSHQVIRPGQVNLMSAGRGVSHSEESTGSYAGVLEGIQLWIAQTEATRWDAPAFRHHSGLPTLELSGGSATVVVGALGGVRSPEAPYGADVVAVDLDLTGPSALPLRPDHEYALIVMRGQVALEGRTAHPAALFYLGMGRDRLNLEPGGPDRRARAMVIGGTPFAEEILMWWNFVGRTRAEMADGLAAWRARDERFGVVDSTLERHQAPDVPWPAA